MNHVPDLIAAREKDFPGALMEARKILLEGVGDSPLDSPGDGNTLVLLAEVHFWLGALNEDGQLKEEFLAAGVKYGQEAATSRPGSVAANFWYARCMAEHARVLGTMNTLHYFGPIEEHGNLARVLDEYYHEAGPLRLMAWFYCTVPISPAGPGNRKKGLELARRAFELAPAYPGNTVVLAEAYLSGRYFEKARSLVREVLSVSGPVENRLSHARFRARARKVLDRLEKME